MILVQILVSLALASAVLALFFCVKAEPLGQWLGLVDKPDGQRKLHQGHVPLIGGFPVVSAVLLSGATMTIFYWHDEAAFAYSLCWFLIAVAGFFLIGLVDDHHELSAKRRLILFFSFLLLILSAEKSFILQHLVFSNGYVLELQNFGVLFTLICIAGLVNAVNMADGKNGLVIGLAIIWLVLLGLHASFYLWPIIIAMIVALVITFHFNMRGRLFLGDGGSYTLSAAIAFLTIYIYNQFPVNLPADQVALMFAFPVMDALRLIIQRVRNGVSPFAGDRNHLHHYLWVAVGWPVGLWVYLLLVLGFVALGQWFHDDMLWVAGGAVVVYMMIIGVFSRFLKDKQEAQAGVISGFGANSRNAE